MFTYHAGQRTFQSLETEAGDCFPYLLVNIGSGVSMLKAGPTFRSGLLRPFFFSTQGVQGSSCPSRFRCPARILFLSLPLAEGKETRGP